MIARARPRPMHLIAALLAVGFVMTGCGDDGDDESAAPTSTSTAATSTGSPSTTAAASGTSTQAACEAFIAIDQAFSIDEDLEAGVEALTAFVAAAPPDVGASVQPLIVKLGEDPEAALESEEVGVAEDAADAWAYDNCGDTTVDADAFNFAFVGVPPEIDAGRVVFRLTNRSETGEIHEALILRRMDGATDSAHDILAAALAGEHNVENTLAALERFDFVGVGFVEPGPEGRSEDVFAVDLEPGRYIVACILPVDSPNLIEAYFGGEAIDAPFHFEEGMFVEFAVT